MSPSIREQKTSFAFETVFSHPSTLLDMQRAQTLGFEVVVVFVTTANPEINVARVAGRFRAGGHEVPVDRIRRRYERVMTLLPRIVEQADRAFVYDNSGEAPHVLPFLGGSPVQQGSFPDFLRRRLVEPLAARRAERIAQGAAVAADEADGISTGAFVAVGEHFAVQDVDGVSVRHDRLLLEGTTAVGAWATVRYVDAAGTLSPV